MNVRTARRTATRSPRRTNADGRARAVIDHVYPELDCGRFAVKRIVGDRMIVEADVFADGHDVIACMLGYRRGLERDVERDFHPELACACDEASEVVERAE